MTFACPSNQVGVWVLCTDDLLSKKKKSANHLLKTDLLKLIF